MRLILVNKPFRMLTAFRARDGRASLADLLEAPGCHPAGRLDADSEGLLLLTDSGSLQARLSHPRYRLPKRYLVQIEGQPSAQALRQLRTGVPLTDGVTLPADVSVVDEPAWLWPRVPPIRFRRHIPTTWLEITIREGRNRQIRRMTAAVSHPTLRLIRRSVGPLDLQGLAPGRYRHATSRDLAALDAALQRVTTLRVR